MEEEIFKMKRVGLVGGRPVDRQYMMRIEERAKKIEEAISFKPKKDKQDERQMKIPF